MAQISEFNGLHRDLPIGPSVLIPAGTAGSSYDYEHVLAVVPDLTKLAGSGQAGDLPLNAMTLRLVALITETSLTGQATNYFTWNVLQKRAGALLVNTTASAVNTSTSTAVSAAGSVTITPASMTGIFVGNPLLVDTSTSQETVIVTAVTATTFTATFTKTHSSTWTIVSTSGAQTIAPASMANIFVGTPLLVDTSTSQETVVVTAVTSTTFTATFANAHSSTWTIASPPLVSIVYSSSGVTETALTPHQIASLVPNILKPGDVLTFQRVSSNGTGLASPALTVQLDWAPTQGRRPAA
jgi:hypothetical protein